MSDEDLIIMYPKTGLPANQAWAGDFLLSATTGKLTHIPTPADEAKARAAGARVANVSYAQYVALGGAVTAPAHQMLPGGVDVGQLTQGQISYAGKGSYGSGEAFCREVVTAVCGLLQIPTTHWVPGMVTIAGRETSYNSPSWQVNDTDLNAVGPYQSDGHRLQCSRGGWQCVPWFANGGIGTFAKYHRVGTSTRIYDPYACCAAAIAYIVLSYGIAWDGHDLLTKHLGAGNGSSNGYGIQQADPNRIARGY